MSTETDPLRVEHRKLLTRIDELRRVAATVGPWSARAAELDDVVTFLRSHLVPHMRAEESVIYPAVERAMRSPRAMETMVADHEYIAREIDTLPPTAAALGPEPRVEGLEALRAQLCGVCAILHLHFTKEEEVLLPVLEEALTPDERRVLFEQMIEQEHVVAGHAT